MRDDPGGACTPTFGLPCAGRYYGAGRAASVVAGDNYPACVRAMTGYTQQLYLVYGGELVDPAGNEYADPGRLDIRGIFDSYEAAYKIWKGASFQAVDNALVRYRIVPLF